LCSQKFCQSNEEVETEDKNHQIKQQDEQKENNLLITHQKYQI